MNMTQTLKNFFSKKSATNHKVVTHTDAESQKRSAVLDLSSKTMSRIATFTLFCFLSQTFSSVLWANPGLPKHHHFHESGYVGLHIVPEFDADQKITGMRINVSVSEQLYGVPKKHKKRASAKLVCSTLLTRKLSSKLSPF